MRIMVASGSENLIAAVSRAYVQRRRLAEAQEALILLTGLTYGPVNP